jgi:hypothetical protein
MSAAELLEELNDKGVEISVDGENITCRSAQPISEELVIRLRKNKSGIIRLLKRRTVEPYLDDQGRFCVKGGLLDEPILDALLRVGASDDEIEKHIGPIHQRRQWERWQIIKSKGVQ